MEKSVVEPPISATIYLPSFFISILDDSIAAVGSAIIRNTFRPANSPANFVADFAASEKNAGTVITASLTSSPR